MKPEETTLIKQLNIAERILGTEGIVNLLQKGIEDKFSDNIILFIVTTVTNAIGLPPEQLGKLQTRDDRKKVCLGFCSYFLNSEFNYSYLEISQKLPFGYSTELLWKYATLIKKAKLDKPKSDIDQLIASNYKKITDQIQNHKTQVNETFSKQPAS